MELLFIAVFLGAIVAAIASAKGRYGSAAFGWFLYGFLLFPVVLVHVLCVRPQAKEANGC